MAKKKTAAPAEDTYDEPEVATDPVPEYTPDATAEVAVTEPEPEAAPEPKPKPAVKPATVLPPSAEAIAEYVLEKAKADGCVDVVACTKELKRAQYAFAELWHKAYS